MTNRTDSAQNVLVNRDILYDILRAVSDANEPKGYGLLARTMMASLDRTSGTAEATPIVSGHQNYTNPTEFHVSPPIVTPEQIELAHPLRTGRHDLYAEAMRLVGERHDKGDLVDLVTCLLQRVEDACEAAVAPNEELLRLRRRNDAPRDEDDNWAKGLQMGTNIVLAEAAQHPGTSSELLLKSVAERLADVAKYYPREMEPASPLGRPEVTPDGHLELLRKGLLALDCNDVEEARKVLGGLLDGWSWGRDKAPRFEGLRFEYIGTEDHAIVCGWCGCRTLGFGLACCTKGIEAQRRIRERASSPETAPPDFVNKMAFAHGVLAVADEVEEDARQLVARIRALAGERPVTAAHETSTGWLSGEEIAIARGLDKLRVDASGMGFVPTEWLHEWRTRTSGGERANQAQKEEKDDEQGIRSAHAERDRQGEGAEDRGGVRRAAGDAPERADAGRAPLSAGTRAVDREDEAGGSVLLREEGDGWRGRQQLSESPNARKAVNHGWCTWINQREGRCECGALQPVEHDASDTGGAALAASGGERASGPGTIDPAAQTLVDRLVEENRPKGGERTKLPISDNARKAAIDAIWRIAFPGSGRTGEAFAIEVGHVLDDLCESPDAGSACPANCANGWRPVGDLPCPRCNADGRRPRASKEGAK